MRNSLNWRCYAVSSAAPGSERLVGFNSHAFDDKLCQANGIEITSDFDLLGEIRVASGQPTHYVKGLTRAGYSLEKIAQANLGYGKTGTGANAPELWQLGKKEEVINYCLKDIQITKDIYFRFIRGKLTDPNTGEKLSYFNNQSN